MKIALVHDYLVQYGGAERVLEVFTELFPDAPVYTLLYDKEAMQGRFEQTDIRTSFLQKVPFAKKHHRLFPLLMPQAIESFDFSRYDVVLSDSSSYAKSVITGPDTFHICYMHTPMRYVWDDCQKYTHDFGFPKLVSRMIPFFVHGLRIWDRVSAARPDRVVANSQFVAGRIQKYYQREASVIHPPVDVSFFQTPAPKSALRDQLEQERYFLMVGRLIAYKRHDIAIRAFNALGLKLKIIGRGPELARLKQLAGPTIEFLGRVNDEDLPVYYQNCEAFIFPQEEDFGIVAIEALAAGAPLIAFYGGDIPEHVSDPETGVFFYKQTPEALEEAVGTFQSRTFDKQVIRESAQRFDKERFRATIKDLVETVASKHKG